jgi:histidyl-tRNA synthetase
MTPTLARMAAAHERNYRKPIKWFSIPQLFRYERQQKGRLREHFQLNGDILGERNPATDAELIALMIDVLRSVGLTAEDFVIRLSSRDAWQEFFSRRCADSARAYPFYQIIDKLEREEPAQSESKLAALGFSLAEVNEFIRAGEPTADLRAVIENLQDRGLGDFVKVDYTVIRGLAYYTGVVFEAFDRKGEFRAIAGGGRYDNLVKLISGGRVDLSAIGFGMGDVVLLELLRQRGLLPKFSARLDLYCLIEDEAVRKQSLAAIQVWREAGLSVDYSFSPMKPDKQFKRAVESGATHTVRLEATEGGTITKCKRLATRTEAVLRIEELAAFVATAT